ncbi:MAG: hypothetical protein EOO42_15285 [Flavobacteriales bacterium]|nr:MAG: hypothetical protein EOO42_15285 [Flavobacteriales bacterium]
MRNLWLMLFLIAVTFSACRNGEQQQPKITGLKLADSISASKIPFIVLPQSPNLRWNSKQAISLSGLPPVKNQGNILSCASWASAYYLTGYYNRLKKGNSDYNTSGVLDLDKIFSPLYVHNQVINCTSNCITCLSSNYDVLNFLSDNGVTTYKDFNTDSYGEASRCRVIPEASLRIKAKEQKLESYGQVFNPYLKLSSDEKYQLLKNTLLSKIPIVISMSVTDNFKNLNKNNYIWNNYGGASSAANHAMLCIGFSDKLNAIQVINSWGTDWGLEGTAWISANLFDKYLLEGYSVNISPQFLIPAKDMLKNNYVAQTPGKSITLTKSDLNITAAEFITVNEGKYQELNGMSITPIKITDTSSIIKIYRRKGNKIEVMKFTSLTINSLFQFIADKKFYRLKLLHTNFSQANSKLRAIDIKVELIDYE